MPECIRPEVAQRQLLLMRCQRFVFDQEKTIADLTESSKKIEGLFTIYQDTINGKLKMVISKNQFEKELGAQLR